jgi:hypothetical protein
VKSFTWLILWAVLAACGPGSQELVSGCLNDPMLCPACGSDADCVIVSNACHETASCAHREANVAVTQEGCSQEHDPPDDRCACLGNICQAEKTFCAIPEGCPGD